MSEFNNAIIDYLKTSIPQGVEVSEITLETDLISTGIIDSFGIVGIVMFLEDTYGIEVSDDDIDPDIFRTVVSIASYIKHKQ
tara:strand:- start:682 stop:927 length:246 start_codon:yes stop_codon:yes gene_type:complete